MCSAFREDNPSFPGNGSGGGGGVRDWCMLTPEKEKLTGSHDCHLFTACTRIQIDITANSVLREDKNFSRGKKKR